MEDLLGIEVDYKANGSIKLHQRKYIEKMVERFMPNGPLPKAQRNSLPYSGDFLTHINDSLSQQQPLYPELVRDLQSRVGCLMYAATSTRPATPATSTSRSVGSCDDSGAPTRALRL